MSRAFEPWQSSDHDDRCCCPVCSGLCQDDYEFYSQTGQYAPTAQQAMDIIAVDDFQSEYQLYIEEQEAAELAQAQAEFNAVPSYIERFKDGQEEQPA